MWTNKRKWVNWGDLKAWCVLLLDHTWSLSYKVSRGINSTLSCFPGQSPRGDCTGRCLTLLYLWWVVEACPMRHGHTPDFSPFSFAIYRLFHNSREHQRNEYNYSEQRWTEVNSAEAADLSLCFCCHRCGLVRRTFRQLTNPRHTRIEWGVL